MIKIKTIFSNVWDLIRFHPMTEEDLKKDSTQINIGTSMMALCFIIFFTYIDQIPVHYVLKVYSILTEDWFKLSIVTISLFSFCFAMYYKSFSIVLFVSVFSIGQFLFVHVYNNQYSLETNTMKIDEKKEKTRFYSVHWNIG